MDENATLIAKIKTLEAENDRLKRNQVEINQAKELYLKIFEDFPALIWRSGLDKKCNYFNKTWLDFTGRSFEQENGNGWAEGVHSEDFDFCLDTYVKAFDLREAFYMEYRLKNKAGEYRWIRDIGRPFYDLDNTFLGYIGSCYDITESKDNELKLEELNATKNKFLSILAHDLRTPFSTLISFSNLLLDERFGTNSAEINALLTKIQSVSIHSMAYLDDLLLWGRMISDGVILNKQHFQSTFPCHELLVEMEEPARSKNITLEFVEESPVELYADSYMFKTILRNLLNNALKFTRRNGHICLSVRKNDSFIEISVADNGVGMEQNMLDILWNFNTNITTEGTDQEVGTGFGLSICKQLVEKHQGKIWVKSEKNKGSEFTFQLPL
jgi:two-component system CheB/CheR fusion protein